MNQMRVSLVQKGNEIRGTIQSTGDGLFVLESLALIVEQVARKTGVEAGEVVRDLYALVTGKVTP